jgi:hypothetical protein
MSELQEVKVAIKWPVNPGPAVFANNVTLQLDTDGNVYLTFFQVIPPVLLGEGDSRIEERIKSVTSVEAIPVARIAISEPDAIKLHRLFKRHFEAKDDTTTSKS